MEGETARPSIDETCSFFISMAFFRRRGKHNKITPSTSRNLGRDKPDTVTTEKPSLFPAIESSRSIFLVMMRMEAEAISEQIKTCMASLKQLKRGEVYASSNTPVYSLGDAMAFVELAYANALDSIQQRDNDMTGQWLDMAKLAQEYVTVLTKYLEVSPQPSLSLSSDHETAIFEAKAFSMTNEHDIDHMAEPGLEDWSRTAVMDFEIRDCSSSPLPEASSTPKKKERWHMDPIVTKTFTQKHVDEEARQDVYDLVIVDLAPKPFVDGRDPVDEPTAFDNEGALPMAWMSSKAFIDPQDAVQPSEAVDNVAPDSDCPTGAVSIAAKCRRRPRKLSAAWPPQPR